MEPRIQYTKTSYGVSIAFSKVGANVEGGSVIEERLNRYSQLGREEFSFAVTECESAAHHIERKALRPRRQRKGHA